MEPLVPYRLVFFLEGGRVAETQESFVAGDDPHDEIEAAVEDRESPWKTFGHLTLHFKDIKGWSAERIPQPTQLKGTAS